MTLPETFFNPKQARRRPITAAKRKAEEKEEREKKFQKSKSVKP